MAADNVSAGRSSAAPGVPDAWYPDPTGRYDYRYWHAGAWTEHVSRRGVAMVDPQPLTPPGSPVEHAGLQTGTEKPEPHAETGGLGALAQFRAGRRAKAEHREDFQALALRAARGDQGALQELPAAVHEARGLWRASGWEAEAWSVLGTAVRHVLQDDVITDAEEAQLGQLARILGTPLEQLHQRNPELFEELVIAAINDKRFPVLADPPIILKAGETAYASFGVAVLKEVAVREYRGGGSSVSVPIVKGVRYRVGGFRGHSVQVGTELVAEDTGVLVVTSARTLFVGQHKTLEFRHDRLVGLQQYTDGLRLNVSNRQAASVFRFAGGQSPSIAAALISATASQD